MKNISHRIEQDLLGRMEVPADAYYGIHSVRARNNLRVLGAPVHPELVLAMAAVKKACAMANMKTGYLEKRIGEAIVSACNEIAGGSFAEQFITDALQGGAGTSLNMNVNEVVANRAVELLGGDRGDYALVHPLDHVNMSQSTNDVVPTAVKVAAIRRLKVASQAMSRLQGVLQQKEAEFAGVLKVGRTQLQDAVPITLGQEFAAWAQAVGRDWWRLHKVEERLRQVNLGGTAVGTGLNAESQYVFSVVDLLREETGLGLARAENLMDCTQNYDSFVEVSGMIKAAATTLAKISGDIRLMASGPRAGLGELVLPMLQAGSSIMPGKVNPVATEGVTQAAYQIYACDLAVTMASGSGQLELNAFLPCVAHNLLLSLDLLIAAVDLLGERCIKGIAANRERCRELLERSAVVATAMVPYIGYDEASDLARTASERGVTVEELALERGFFSESELRAMVTPSQLTRPGIAGLDVIGKKEE